jgi:hypothetical protein
MPANKKHLNPSFHHRFAKITAGFIGGFIITIALAVVLAVTTDHVIVIYTLKYVGFIFWCVLMLIPFLFENGWKAWGQYLIIILLLFAILYIIYSQTPQSFSFL